VPVVVTAHAVIARIAPWERDATVLVATTSTDADLLRRRWPGKWIELIPYGCPPPIERSRRTRGAIAIVGAAPSAERAARHAGLRVVALAPGQRPQAELARWLAEHSDVVVFAKAGDHRLDVGAALASGVPVVAPPDPSLADLGGAVCRSTDVAEGTLRVLEGAALRRELVDAAHEHCRDHSWTTVAGRHAALWTALETT
jgi:glycosyltransferase involved in cell wall biosynthesis